VLADAHRQAALDLERSIADLGDPAVNPWNARAIIELYWGTAFHWVAYGCQVKHGKHKENHTKLISYLRDLGRVPSRICGTTSTDGVMVAGMVIRRCSQRLCRSRAICATSARGL
jgi:hypothetical protein